MEYLCEKQISIGGGTYCPGEIIPDGVVLDGRAGKLSNNGYISAIRAGIVASGFRSGAAKLYTEKEAAAMVAAALAEAEPALGAWEGTVRISVKCASNGRQATEVFAKPNDILQAFSILQMNAEEGAKEISGVDSENVLTLLYAADSRATMKHAAKKRMDGLFPAGNGKKGAKGVERFAAGVAEGLDAADGRGGDG